jgi:hypothetical protein
LRWLKDSNRNLFLAGRKKAQFWAPVKYRGTKKEPMKEKTRLEVQRLGEKYYDLVSFYRLQPRDYRFQDALNFVERVAKDSPKEIEELKDDESAQFAHGMHCGFLAAMRFFHDAEEGSVSKAVAAFPCIETR